jgi:hypothetical protein
MCVCLCVCVCVCVCVCSPHTPSGWTQRNKTATQSAHGRTVPFLFYNLERTFCSSRGCNQVQQQHLHNSLQDTVIVFTRGDISDDDRHPFVQMWYVCVCSACGGCCCLGGLDIHTYLVRGEIPRMAESGSPRENSPVHAPCWHRTGYSPRLAGMSPLMLKRYVPSTVPPSQVKVWI